MTVPVLRIRGLNERPVNPDGQYILYWMTSNRRLHFNFSLDRAIEWSLKLRKPLLIFEGLRCDYQWASRRLHSFVIQGMVDQEDIARSHGHCYVPYVERSYGDGSGLIRALLEHAAVAVTDDFPCFFLPRMSKAVARRSPVLMECVDSNGLLPMRATSDVFPSAYAFRRFLQRSLAPHLSEMPNADPLADPSIPRGLNLPDFFRDRWRPASSTMLGCNESEFQHLPIDHSVREAVMKGGEKAAVARMTSFLRNFLNRYGEERNEPDEDVASGLSPYLHFGHISVHQIFQAIVERERWSPEKLGDVRKIRGSREGWWGVSASTESFLDELVTWRELGYNFCSLRSDYDRYDSLPEWAKETLALHESDHRPWLYSLRDLELAKTHDPLWNAAQTQLVTEGRMHNYLRMLWGKKILEWSPTPREALHAMIELNNRFAVDGRNPNSYSGIFWVLGRFDRPWGPERPIFGKIRYMTSDNTARKLKLTNYLRKYGSGKLPSRSRKAGGKLFD